MHYVLRSNLGDDSIALILWASRHLSKPVDVLVIDTGWGAPDWYHRLAMARQLTESFGMQFHVLKAPLSFSDLVIERHAFPTAKFQWCTGLLKGAPAIEWLDKCDPTAESTILIAKRHAQTDALSELPDSIISCPYHGDRTVWHPIVNLTDEDVLALLKTVSWPALNKPSQECYPCINNTCANLKKLDKSSSAKLRALEKRVGKQWPEAADDIDDLGAYYRGCGNHFGCGL